MSTYDFRRKLTARDHLSATLAAAGAALGVGLVVYYLARLLLQRAPLEQPKPPARRPG
ncbi:MAG: hypothetical protein ACREKN_01840 [Longimicrobiaceae bacterium]